MMLAMHPDDVAPKVGDKLTADQVNALPPGAIATIEYIDGTVAVFRTQLGMSLWLEPDGTTYLEDVALSGWTLRHLPPVPKPKPKVGDLLNHPKQLSALPEGSVVVADGRAYLKRFGSWVADSTCTWALTSEVLDEDDARVIHIPNADRYSGSKAA